MYLNPHNEALVQQIDMMDRKKVRNMEAIDEGAGYSGGNWLNQINQKKYTYKELGIPPPIWSPPERQIGGKRRRGRPSKKMQGEGILGDIGGIVDGLFGLGKQKGQKRYKKQPEEMYACGGSGFASGSHMDTGFDMTEGAGGSGGGFSGGMKQWSPEELKKMEYLFFGKGRAKKMKEKLEGAGFWGDFFDGFKSGFSSTMDLASKALPVVAPFIGLGKKGRKTTRTDLEQMGKYVPDKAVEQSQMLGSDMSGMGKKSKKCMCEGQGVSGGADNKVPNVFTQLMEREQGKRKNISLPYSPPRQVRTLVVPPAPKRRKTGQGRSGGRRTEEMGDFSGGGGSGGKRAPNAWLQLVNKVRREQGFKGVKEAIAYIKSHSLYKK